MSALEKLAYAQGRRDEVPNQDLAKELAAKGDRKGVREIGENLWNKDKNIQADCIKVLYEVGYIKPQLIGDYVEDFVKLLASKNNRLVWGGMTALSTIAAIRPKDIYANLSAITSAIESGSVITIDNGIRVLARAASTKEEYNKKIFPYLIKHLSRCRPKEVGQHAESILVAVNAKNKKQYLDVLNKRASALTPAQAARVKKLYRTLENV